VDQLTQQIPFYAVRHCVKPGVTALGLKEGGAGLAMDEHNAKLVTPAMRSRLDSAQADIVGGKLKVIDYTVALACK